MPRPGSHAAKDWPLVQAAVTAEGLGPLPPRARRMMSKVHHHIDRQQAARAQHLHFMRRAPDQPSAEAWKDAVGHIRRSGLQAVQALQRWRGEPRDKDALFELVRTLTHATHAVRDSFSDGHTARDPRTLRIRKLKNFKGDGPLHLIVGFLWHIPKDLATEMPPHRDAAVRADAADEAVADLAGLIVHASLYGPTDAPHVFARRFDRFVHAHLAPGGAVATSETTRRSAPQGA